MGSVLSTWRESLTLPTAAAAEPVPSLQTAVQAQKQVAAQQQTIQAQVAIQQQVAAQQAVQAQQQAVQAQQQAIQKQVATQQQAIQVAAQQQGIQAQVAIQQQIAAQQRAVQAIEVYPLPDQPQPVQAIEVQPLPVQPLPLPTKTGYISGPDQRYVANWGHNGTLTDEALANIFRVVIHPRGPDGRVTGQGMEMPPVHVRMYESEAMVGNVKQSDLVLDVEGGSKKEGARVILWPRHGGKNQLVEMYTDDGGERKYTYFKFVHSGLYLSMDDAGNLIQAKYPQPFFIKGYYDGPLAGQQMLHHYVSQKPIGGGVKGTHVSVNGPFDTIKVDFVAPENGKVLRQISQMCMNNWGSIAAVSATILAIGAISYYYGKRSTVPKTTFQV